MHSYPDTDPSDQGFESKLQGNWTKKKGRPRERGQGQRGQRSLPSLRLKLKLLNKATINYVYFVIFPALSLSSVDLEQICLSRLELAEIASQRHHALTSGNIVYACMRALEDAAVLNELDLEKR